MNSLLKLLALVSSALLIGALVCYRAGALGNAAAPAPQASGDGPPAAAPQTPEAPATPTPVPAQVIKVEKRDSRWLMVGSKSGPVVNGAEGEQDRKVEDVAATADLFATEGAGTKTYD